MSPGSTSISTSSTTTAVTLKSDERSVLPMWRTASEVDPELEVGHRRQQPLEIGRLVLQRRLLELDVALLDGRAQDHVAADADQRRLRPGLQRRHLDRPGRRSTGARQASRQPARSSSRVNARGSTRRDRHGAARQSVPCTSCRCRGHRRWSRSRRHSRTRRRRSSCPRGRASPCRRARSGCGRGPAPSPRSAGSARSRRRCRLTSGGGRRSSARPTRHARAGGRRPGRRRRTARERASMIALVSPWLAAIDRKAAFRTCRPGKAEGRVGRTAGHVHPELVADQARRLQEQRDGARLGADRHRQRVDDHIGREGCRDRRPPRRSCAQPPGGAPASIGISSSLARPITAAPCRATSGRIASSRSSSPVTELTSALPS